MDIPPRPSDESIFAGGMLFKIVIRGLMIGAASLLSFMLADKSMGIEGARTAAMVTLSLSQLIFVFECKNENRGIFNARYLSNPKLIFAVLISLAVTVGVVYMPVLGGIFNTVALSKGVFWASVGLAFAAPVLHGVVELMRVKEE